MQHISRRWLVLSAMWLAFFLAVANATDKTEILWDRWGVPHVYAADNRELFRAFGRAQMESHANLILTLYGKARGRAAEYWGESNLQFDRIMHSMGLPKLARTWLAAQEPEFRGYLDAFVAGMNEYAASNKEKLKPENLVVLPLTTEDMVAHTIRVVHLTFVAGDALGQTDSWTESGSNAWAIAPSKSTSGNALLLANPHLPWSDLFRFYEAHLSAPGLNVYGATLVGFPVLAIAFNDHLGWTHTVNTYDGADLYELKLSEGGYLIDGQTKSFETERVPLRIKGKDGTVREQPYAVRRSIHGPVVSQKDGKALALRIAGLDRPGMLREWWNMGRASNFKEFERALRSLQIPMFNIIYADREGRILFLHNGCIPVRSKGDFQYWYGIVPGDSSSLLWNAIHPYAELPQVVSPPSGWLANSNEPPYFCTKPIVMDWKRYPAYFSPSPDFFSIGALLLRPQRSVRMLSESGKISLDEMIRLKHSTREEAADRLLGELIESALQSGNSRAKEAAAVLKAWDRSTDANSRGAVLFARWFDEMGGDPFARRWQEGAWYDTPSGLRDAAAAVTALQVAAEDTAAKYGNLDVAWGDVNRFRIGGYDFAGNGGSGSLGIFRVIEYGPDSDGKARGIGGDSFVAAVEFSNPVKGRVLLSYGNSTEPGSKHVGDQLELLSRKELRPAWRDRGEIERNLERREVLR